MIVGVVAFPAPDRDIFNVPRQLYTPVLLTPVNGFVMGTIKGKPGAGVYPAFLAKDVTVFVEHLVNLLSLGPRDTTVYDGF